MQIEGMDRQKYLEYKFNGKESAKKIYQDIYDEGLKNSIYFQFDKINITPNFPCRLTGMSDEQRSEGVFSD